MTFSLVCLRHLETSSATRRLLKILRRPREPVNDTLGYDANNRFFYIWCSSLIAAEIQVKVKEAKITEVKINEAREHYRPAAARASLLYFIMNDLNKTHPMYQFSLKVCL